MCYVVEFWRRCASGCLQKVGSKSTNLLVEVYVRKRWFSEANGLLGRNFNLLLSSFSWRIPSEWKITQKAGKIFCQWPDLLTPRSYPSTAVLEKAKRYETRHLREQQARFASYTTSNRSAGPKRLGGSYFWKFSRGISIILSLSQNCQRMDSSYRFFHGNLTICVYN